MRDNILRYLRENELIAPGATLVCAVSGGKDSVCLLHMMLSLQDELQITVEAAHLNHRLRGAESDRDEAFVRNLCDSLGVRLTVSRADVLSRCKQTGESVEEAARVLRYQFFESLGKPVVTAHTQDDNLETVLLNLVRGTALRGLCGIPPKRGRIIRPMLCVSRAEVTAYLEQHALSHVEDSSNASSLPLRNRLRHEVVPLLARENPKLSSAVFHMSEILREEDVYLDKEAASLLRRAKLPDGGWSCHVLRDAPDALLLRAMRQLLSELSISKPSRAHVEALMRLVVGKDGSQSVTLPGGKLLCRSYDKLAPDLRESPAGFTPKTLSPDGVTEIPELSLRVSCRFVKNFEKSMLSPCTFALRYDTIEAPKDLLIRPRKQGDEIRLPGGRKTLKKLFIDRKIPASQRALVPVVTDGVQVLLVYPFAVSSEHGAQPGEAALLIQFMHEKEYIQKEDTQ